MGLLSVTMSKRKELSLVQKVELINDHEKGDKSQRLLAEKYGVGKTQIQTTLKRKAEYLTAFEDNAGPTFSVRRHHPEDSNRRQSKNSKTDIDNIIFC